MIISYNSLKNLNTIPHKTLFDKKSICSIIKTNNKKIHSVKGEFTMLYLYLCTGSFSKKHLLKVYVFKRYEL
jgi:hypothetical protein